MGIAHDLSSIDQEPESGKQPFQGLLQFLYFVANKRNITKQLYSRIHNEFVR